MAGSRASTPGPNGSGVGRATQLVATNRVLGYSADQIPRFFDSYKLREDVADHFPMHVSQTKIPAAVAIR